MTLNVTLVNPPYPEKAHQHPSFIPLGLAYLGAVLEKNGYSVNVIDCQAQKLTYVDLEREIGKHQPRIVGITSTTLTYKSALKVARIAKQVHPECLTILGGCHATFWDDKALEECPQLDVIVRKEGEYTLLEIANRLKENKRINDVLGTTCKENGKIIRNADRPYIEDLDSLPFPAHHLLPLRHLRTMGRIIFPLTTSRGCVYWCNFCTAVRMFGRGYRMRSPKNVVDEMQFLNEKYGASQFTFYDDAFTVNQARTEKICEEIQNRGLKFEWDCEARVDMVTKELLQKMKKAGCIAVWFGVESGCQNLIESMGKSFNIVQTRRAFKWAKEAGLMTEASVILGFPGETKETALKTVKFAEELNPILLGYYIATPYPGTPMYDYVKENGWLKITDFDRYDTATPTFESPTLSMKELAKIREKAYQRFYLRPTYILRTLWEGVVHGISSDKGGIYGIASARNSFARLLRALGFKFA
jgi:anaerobic magnesium-protoporphyrin IX monomethyl ester cyclase